MVSFDQMGMTATDTADTVSRPKNCIVKAIWSHDLLPAPGVESRNDHASELSVFAPQFDIERAVSAMEQNGVLKGRSSFTFNRRQVMAGYQQFICGRCPDI